MRGQIITTIVGVGLILAAPLPAAAQPGGPQATPVRVATAEVREMRPTTTVPGTVVSRDEARVAAEVAGVLEEVAEVGTQVEAGEPVARIEDTSLELQRDELRAVVERERARLGFLENEEKRLQRLAQENNAAKNRLEEVRSNRDVARGELRVAQARLAQVEDRLSRTVMRAAFDGTVTERIKRAGERVTEGDAVVRVVNTDSLEVRARAPLEYMPFIVAGESLALTNDGHSVDGRVRATVPLADERTHLFELRVALPAGIWPVGQTVRVRVPVAHTRQAVTVPRDALVLRREGAAVFVVDRDSIARRIEVATGIAEGERIEVKGEIAPGDRVVTRGNERLQPGQSVQVLEG